MWCLSKVEHIFVMANLAFDPGSMASNNSVQRANCIRYNDESILSVPDGCPLQHLLLPNN